MSEEDFASLVENLRQINARGGSFVVIGINVASGDTSDGVGDMFMSGHVADDREALMMVETVAYGLAHSIERGEVANGKVQRVCVDDGEVSVTNLKPVLS